MDAQSRDVVTFLLATSTSVLVILGLAARFVLLPWLKDQLVQPVQETHQQVTENHHASPGAPTLPDRLEDVDLGLKALAHVMDNHLAWSDRWTDLYEAKLDLLASQLKEGTEKHDETNPST